MTIEPITMWRVDGQTFETKQKAIDHIEGKIEWHVRAMLAPTQASHRDRLTVMEYLLANRDFLAVLLSYGIADEDTERL